MFDSKNQSDTFDRLRQKLEAEAAGEKECFLEILADSDAESADDYDFIIPMLVPKSEPMIIGGKGSAGKSSLALELSCRILESDLKAVVVYICAEGTYKDTKIKARRMGLTRFKRFFFLKRGGGATSFKLSETYDLDLVSRTLQDAKENGHRIVLVVIDSIRGMQRGSLNDDAVGEVMQEVNAEICQKLGATVCYIHHSKKNIQDLAAMDALLGSVYIVNSVRHVLFIRKKSARSRTVEVAKSNLDYEDHWWMATLADGNRINLIHKGLIGEDEDPVDQSQLDKAESILLNQLGAGEPVPAVSIFQIGEYDGVSGETMRRAKNLYVIRVFKQQNRWFWQMALDENGNPRVKSDLK